MPPVGFRKREHSPAPTPPSKRQATSKPAAKRGKATLFEAADTPQKPVRSVEETKQLLDENSGDDESSQVDSDEFEDVPPAKKRKTLPTAEEEEGGDDASEDEMDWEDAIGAGPSNVSMESKPEPEIGDISVSMKDDGTHEDPLVSLATGKKGPSKRERQVRILTHKLHVQSLMWHNTVRNSWLNDKEVQKTLVDSLTDGVKGEVTRWKEAMGTLSTEELEAKKRETAAKNRRKGRKGKDTSKARDWGYQAQHSEQGVPNLSAGDPLLRLLKVLTAYWRKRFTVTAPAFRKRGYMPLKRLREEIKAWDNNRNDADDHGERIEKLEAFRKLAKSCEGSRDVGGQLFVALLRGLGLETRMVSNLQPAGIGWSKSEEADPKKTKKEKKAEKEAATSEADEKLEKSPVKKTNKKPAGKPRSSIGESKPTKPARKSVRGNKGEPISLDDSDSPLSEPPSGAESVVILEDDDSDDLSVIDVTPARPKAPTRKYDRDMAFPTYWTEVCSPATNKFIPVDPIVLSTIASNDELLQTFEPRGKGADKSKQAMCYTIAFAADGSAKDVTVRYLKKHQLPGKTKGVRMPAEKVPVYNKRGKVKNYENYDWFQTVMSVYDRPQKKRTTADDLEEQTDLKPFKQAKEEKEVEKESLQWYKQSAEFVLEQHLRREEAILPDAEPVKTFTAKGKGKETTEHPVFRREDVVVCKTVETWHKEGRAINASEQPLKHVPVRGVTLTRKREMEEHLQEHGEKLQQGLYSWDQTDWIIPPPIENGVIPKNAFGNMDVYVKTMVPAGAVHLALKGSAKICRKLQVDYAEACTGFEFGKQRAVPVLTGVVVAKENAAKVKEAWREMKAEQQRKEDTKRTAAALHWWRKMLMGLRIIDRMKAEYTMDGADPDATNPFARKGKKSAFPSAPKDHDVGVGGFFQPGHDEEEVPQHRAQYEGGGFMVDDEDEEEDGANVDGGDGGFLVEEDPDQSRGMQQAATDHTPVTPMSLQSLHQAQARSDEEVEDNEVGDEQVVMDVDDTAPAKSAHTAKAPKKAARSSTTNPKPTPPAKAQRKPRARKVAPTPPTEDEDEDESSLSEPDHAESDGDEEDYRPASPQVIVTPQAKKAHAARRRGSRATQKVTPVRSQYFTAAEDEDDDDDDDESSEQEVVKPTRTTARTRAKR
ncbi:DNA repair protein rhp42 [Fulvia fulva]|uniref:DNA repair protein rhp42 n=1 Tax=Passalora fulva TaxID=5499 RepID=A0A9Q8LDQ2_PASFU|nr:DNA repair protein rhp42 [Fulvia fulva]KAK4628764.1 DNA repair protein rhp42 [Fulvia fulva]KAK4630685.1 DNA repair protein rhp42 [Fulvia fulva]UJO14798.1 DNA repair protein rhp42 [Fulvia fulva]WPV12214.1 DNA repair protein rhp42 [Fulvia fulva]WPV27193.1 DNA repair protein rhp42 [Fulvia fulva]